MHTKSWTLLASFIYITVGWTVNYWLGFVSFEPVEGVARGRDAGAAVVLPLLTGFLLIANWYINHMGAAAMANLCSVNRKWSGERLERHFQQFLRRVTRTCLKYVSIVAVFAAGLYLTVSGAAFYESEQDWRIVLLLQAVPLWTLILLNLTSIYNIYVIFRKTLRYRLRLSLFEVEKLEPISSFLIAIFLLFCLAMAIYSLNMIYVPLVPTDLVLLFLFSVALVVALTFPLNSLKTSLTEQKSEALQHINGLLSYNIDADAEQADKRRLVDNQTRLQYVSDLLLIRKEIAAISSVPVSQPTVLKLVLLFCLPLLSWVGAGLVSQALKLVA